MTIFFGIYSYTKNHAIETVLHWVAIITWAFVLCLFEVSHRIFLSAPDVPYDRPLNEMKREEFDSIVREGNRKLVILDNLVLDVT